MNYLLKSTAIAGVVLAVTMSGGTGAPRLSDPSQFRPPMVQPVVSEQLAQLRKARAEKVRMIGAGQVKNRAKARRVAKLLLMLQSPALSRSDAGSGYPGHTR